MTTQSAHSTALLVDPMSLRRARRVKSVEATGVEIYAEDTRWDFMQTAQETEDEAPDTKEESKPTLPWRALEAIQNAKGEVDVIIDLAELVRQQQAVGAAHVQKPRITIPDLAAEHALRVQSTMQQLQTAGSQLRKGVMGLQARLDKENLFFSGVAELQRSWSVQSTSSREDAYIVNLSLQPGEDKSEQSPVSILKASNGEVSVVDGERQADSIVRGAAAVQEVLLRRQQELVWQQIRQAVIEEANRADEPVHEALRLIQQVQDADSNRLADISAAVLHMFAENVAADQQVALRASVGLKSLPQHSMLLHIRALLLHDEYMTSMLAGLAELAQQLPGLQLKRLATSQPLTSALQATAGDRQLLIIVNLDRIRVERGACLHAVSQTAQKNTTVMAARWASEADSSITEAQLQQVLREACSQAGAL